MKVFLIWLCCSVVCGAADILELVNGDRITGEVLRVEEGRVHLRSDLLGDISLEVASLKTDVAALMEPPALAKPEPKPEPPSKPEHFDLRGFLKVPDPLKADVKFIAYRRDRDYYENAIYVTPSFSWKEGKHLWEWSVNYRFREDNNQTSEEWITREDRLTAEQKYRYDFDKRMFSQSRTFWEKDRVKLIEPRFIQSVGLGVYLVKNEKVQFDMAPGIGYEYVDNGDTLSQKMQPAFDQNFSWAINDRLNYKQSFNFLGAGEEYSYDLVNELEARLNGNVSMVISHSLEYDEQVDSDEESRDERTTGSVRVRF